MLSSVWGTGKRLELGAMNSEEPAGPARETFGSRFGTVATMIGVAVGLGNVWRFPYMVGKFGGAAFVAFYVVLVIAIGVPALMAELALGRHTRRGPVGAFERGGLPFGRAAGWFFFLVLMAALAYYATVVGWVLYYAAAELAGTVGLAFDPSAILPPEQGFVRRSFVLQLACTALVVGGCALVVQRGLRSGIERASTLIMPTLLAILLLLVLRTVTLPGAAEGVRWYVLKFSVADLNADVAMAALGQVVFSMSLGGTFMVLYGSYLGRDASVRRTAQWTAAGDTIAGLLAGLAIVPAVIAFGFEPSSGPGLLFSTIPAVFAAMPLGAVFGFLFFVGLFGAAFLSSVGAFAAMAAGLEDNTKLPRTAAIWTLALVVVALSIPPSINLAIFVPWDLTFGSGVQTLGSLLAVVTVAWCMQRSQLLAQLAAEGERPVSPWLYHWIRFGIPAAILTVGVWWFLTSVLGTATAV